MKTVNLCVLLTCITLFTGTHAIIEFINQGEIEDSKESRKEVYERIAYLNQLTGDFNEFSPENVISENGSSTDYKDPEIPHRWYRKLYVSKSAIQRMNKGLNANANAFMTEDQEPDQNPFAVTLVYAISIKMTDTPGSVVYLAFDHGMTPIANMLKTPEFMTFLKDPRNRFKFYIRLVVLLKRMSEKLGVRLAVIGPYGIGLTKRSTESDGLQFYPVVRDYYHAVPLGDKVESCTPIFNPTSVIFGQIEPDLKYQQRIEIYSVGLLIYSTEVYFAYGVYQNQEIQSELPDWLLDQNPSNELLETIQVEGSEPMEYKFSMEALMSKTLEVEEEYRLSDDCQPENYSNKQLKNNLRFLRQCCLKFFEANPVVTVPQNANYVNFMSMNASMDASAYLTEIYNDLFVLVDSMTNQNNTTLFQRPTYDEGIAKMSDLLTKFDAVLQQVPPENWSFTQQRLLII